ncbi:MAG TPA: bifunctional phosphoribosyl-AMP cyclohydrolase/phosphoribosyl-ATP diphosphatase HisIE [Woeseiaceae bacterium]|nr:bifunctional phosphoribosyl-AMP cyclohydrolase/phosphoribosyl-ATP diphosphatase HisIE [Woeseiaceae bacterium]
MQPDDIDKLDWTKAAGLIPAIVQHALTGAVLMLGYMNRDALRETLARERVVFYSRTRRRLWEKGETSGHRLDVVNVSADCDRDALLVLARPQGPTCHTGTPTCFADRPAVAAENLGFLARLEEVIAQRIEEKPQGSYTARLCAAGPSRIAQKIGEEGVEVALAAAAGESSRIVSESADLLYHLLLLLKSRDLSVADVVQTLASRHSTV